MTKNRNYADEINNRAFEIYVPEYYDRLLPKYFEEKGVAPIYEAFDLNECCAMHCLADIIDMTINNVPFTIKNENDMGIMTEILSGYISQMDTFASMNDSLRAYIANVETARAIIGSNWNDIKKIKRKAKLDSGETPSLIEWINILNPRKL